MTAAKYFLFLLLASNIGVFAQTKAQYERKIKALRDSVSQLQSLHLNSQKELASSDSSLNSLESEIRRTQVELNEDLARADRTMIFQNLWIQVFGVIYAIIGVLLAFFYFFSLRPAVERGERALDRTENAIERFERRMENFEKDFEKKFADSFKGFEEKQAKRSLDEILKDLLGNLQYQKKIAAEKLTYFPKDLSHDQVEQLFQVIDGTIDDYEKKTIVEVLIQLNSNQVQKYFQTWKNVHHLDAKLRETLYLYYIREGIEKFVVPISSFLLQSTTSHLEFVKLLAMLPSHPDDFYSVINNQIIVNCLQPYNLSEVKRLLNENLPGWGTINPQAVNASFLFSKT